MVGSNRYSIHGTGIFTGTPMVDFLYGATFATGGI